MVEYHSIKPLSPSAGTQKQLSWCRQRGTPKKGTPWLLHPTVSPHTSLALPPESGFCPISMSIHFTGFTGLHLLWYPKGCQFLAPAVSPSILSSCWSHQSFIPFVIPKVGNSWPLFSGSHTDLSLHFNLHLNLHLASPAAWMRSVSRLREPETPAMAARDMPDPEEAALPAYVKASG